MTALEPAGAPGNGPPPPSPRTKTAFAIAFAAAFVLVLYWVRATVFIAFSALLLAILVSRIAGIAHRWLHVPRGAAVVATTVLLFGLLAGGAALLALPLEAQMAKLVEDLPYRLEDLEKRLAEARASHPSLRAVVPEDLGAMLRERGASVAGTAVTLARGLFAGLIDVVTLFFLALFFALEPGRYLSGVVQLWPGPDDRQLELLYRIGDALRAWLIAIGLEILAVGALWSVGLWLIGLDYWLLFGVIGGLGEIVPYYGPIIGLVPPLALSLATGPAGTLAVLGVYCVVQVLDSYILLPWLLGREVNLPPVAVLIAISALGSAFGAWGIILAVPILTVLYVVVNEVYLGGVEVGAGEAEGEAPAAASA